MLKKTFIILTSLSIALAAFWYTFIALKQEPIAQQPLLEAYQYQSDFDINFKTQQLDDRNYQFSYNSYDGDVVKGQISYPEKIADNYPVLIGVSAMGRGYARWWADSFKGRPTLTQVHKIAKLASSKGYIVIAIDARFHSTRKDPNLTLRSIWNDLHFFGNKTPYESMIKDTVIDHRVLLDWMERQKKFKANSITVAGYSMGGQISLLLGSIDSRIDKIISIVPPYIDDKIALVAPKNVVSLLMDKPVHLIFARDDENASVEDNDYLYSLITSKNKSRIG